MGEEIFGFFVQSKHQFNAKIAHHHILHGDNPVLDWVRGTTLRPILARLSDPEQNEFQTEFGALLREAYPETGGSTLFPFTRLFVVASHT